MPPKGEGHGLIGLNAFQSNRTGRNLFSWSKTGDSRSTDKTVARQAAWDAPSEDDHFNKMVGHRIVIDDLYRRCLGWK